MTTINKKFDCIAFKRSAQLAIYEEIKNMTREEHLAYFCTRAESGPLGDWWNKKPAGRTPAPLVACCAEKTKNMVHNVVSCFGIWPLGLNSFTPVPRQSSPSPCPSLPADTPCPACLTDQP